MPLLTPTAPPGHAGKLDWAKAGSYALMVGACTLIGATFVAQNLGYVPGELAGAVIASLIAYVREKSQLKANGPTPETPESNPDDADPQRLLRLHPRRPRSDQLGRGAADRAE